MWLRTRSAAPPRLARERRRARRRGRLCHLARRVGTPLKPPDRCRFCRLFAISVSAFAALAGAATTLQFMLSVSAKLAGREYASFVLALSVARSLSPAAVGSA